MSIPIILFPLPKFCICPHHIEELALVVMCFGEGRNEKSLAAIIQAVKDAGTAELIVLLDADATGQKAAANTLKMARQVGLPVKAKRFPTGDFAETLASARLVGDACAFRCP